MTHKSDCATNNTPAMASGPCDCGYLVTVQRESLSRLLDDNLWLDDALHRFRGGMPRGLDFKIAVKDALTAMEAAAR